MHGGQRPISPQVLTKLSRPPSLCRQCTPAVFLGSINTCCNRNDPACIGVLFPPCYKVKVLLQPMGQEAVTGAGQSRGRAYAYRFCPIFLRPNLSWWFANNGLFVNFNPSWS